MGTFLNHVSRWTNSLFNALCFVCGDHCLPRSLYYVLLISLRPVVRRRREVVVVYDDGRGTLGDTVLSVLMARAEYWATYCRRRRRRAVLRRRRIERRFEENETGQWAENNKEQGDLYSFMGETLVLNKL